jgi:hypothetical protein
MTPEDILQKFLCLEQEHRATEDSLSGLKDAEFLESEGLALIADYCHSKGYEWIYKRAELNEVDEEQISTAHYVDSMAWEHPDVEELLWIYNSSLWPEFYSDRDGFRIMLRTMLDEPHNWYHGA